MSKNDITGDAIATKIGSPSAKQNFDSNFDAIFRRNLPLNEYPETTADDKVLCDICGKDLLRTQECAFNSCPLNFVDSKLEW